MTKLPPRMTVADAHQFMQQEPGVYILEIQHDDGCPTLATQQEADCAQWCRPTYRLHRGRPAPVTAPVPDTAPPVTAPVTDQPKVKRGRR